jgi:hypothetical protein
VSFVIPEISFANGKDETRDQRTPEQIQADIQAAMRTLCAQSNSDPDIIKRKAYVYKSVSYVNEEIWSADGSGTKWVMTSHSVNYFVRGDTNIENINQTFTESSGKYAGLGRRIVVTYSKVNTYTENFCDPVYGRPDYLQKAKREANLKTARMVDANGEPVAYDRHDHDEPEFIEPFRDNGSRHPRVKEIHEIQEDIALIKQCYDVALPQMIEDGQRLPGHAYGNSWAYTGKWFLQALRMTRWVPRRWAMLEDCGAQAETIRQRIQTCQAGRQHQDWKIKIGYYQRWNLLDDTYTHDPEYIDFRADTLKQHYIVAYTRNVNPIIVIDPSHDDYEVVADGKRKADYFANGFPDNDDNSPESETLMWRTLGNIFDHHPLHLDTWHW